MPEKNRDEVARSEGPRSGGGVLMEGPTSLSHQLGGLESGVRSPAGSGESPADKLCSYIFSPPFGVS